MSSSSFTHPAPSIVHRPTPIRAQTYGASGASGFRYPFGGPGMGPPNPMGDQIYPPPMVHQTPTSSLYNQFRPTGFAGDPMSTKYFNQPVAPPFLGNLPGYGFPQEYLDWLRKYEQWYHQIIYSRSMQGSQRQRYTPLKYPEKHSRASFGPQNQLITISGQNVMIHHLGTGLIDHESQIDVSLWPGPLVAGKTADSEVSDFIQAQEGRYQTIGDPSQADVSYYNRQKFQIWQILLMLVKQNGRVSGADLAELLIKNNPDEFTEEENDNLSQFRRLLTYGKQRRAFEFAMKNDLEIFAILLKCVTEDYSLFLKMPEESFPERSLPPSYQHWPTIVDSKLSSPDPLYIFFRYHLNQMKSYPSRSTKPPVISNLQQFTILFANDCEVNYSLSGSSLTSELLKFVVALRNNDAQYLISVSPHATFEIDSRKEIKWDYSEEFIFMNEILEFSRNSQDIIIDFIPYKLLFTCKLFDYGFTQQARKYCECIRNSIDACKNLSSSEFSYANVNWDLIVKTIDELESRLSGTLIGSAARIPDQLASGVLDPEELQRINYQREYGEDTNDAVSPTGTERSVSRLDADGPHSYSVGDDCASENCESTESSPRKSRLSSLSENLPPPPIPIKTSQQQNRPVFSNFVQPDPPSTNPYLPRSINLSSQPPIRPASIPPSVPDQGNPPTSGLPRNPIPTSNVFSGVNTSIAPSLPNASENMSYNMSNSQRPMQPPVSQSRGRQRNDSTMSSKSGVSDITGSYAPPDTPKIAETGQWNRPLQPNFEIPQPQVDNYTTIQPRQPLTGFKPPQSAYDSQPVAPSSSSAENYGYEESEAGHSAYGYSNFNFNSTTNNLPLPPVASPVVSPISSPGSDEMQLRRASLDVDYGNRSFLPGQVGGSNMNVINKRQGNDNRETNEEDNNDTNSEEADKQKGSGVLGRIWSKIAPNLPKQAKLPDDRDPSIVFDEKLGKWVDKNDKDNPVTQSIAQGPPRIPLMNAPGNPPPNFPNPSSNDGMAGLSMPTPSISNTVPSNPNQVFSNYSNDSHQQPSSLPPMNPNGFSFVKSKRNPYVDVLQNQMR